MNYSIRQDLLKLNGAFVTNLKGKTATKRCLVIPIDDARLYLGQKGCYLDMVAMEMQSSKYGDTHFLKQNLDKDTYESMTEEERKNRPILGSMRPLKKAEQSIETARIAETEEILPF